MRWTDDSRWHSCFAWFPVKVLHTGEWVWLERLQRRWNDKIQSYEYRDLQDGCPWCAAGLTHVS